MERKSTDQEQWFIEEVLPHERILRIWLSRRFPTISDVDDVVQETFTRMLKAHESGPIANPRAYLFVTAKNYCLNQLRHMDYVRPKGFRAVDPLSIIDDVNNPLEAAGQKEELAQLVESIRSLPERCRQVVILRRIYGFSQKEVAEKMGITVKTVEAQSAIGLRKCAEYFRKNGYVSRFQE